jgi:hypothetical protein
MKVFAFLNVDYPPVAWAVMRGMLVSADQVPEVPQSCPSFMFASLIKSEVNWRLHNETIIEHIRAERYANQISRLRGLYFFESSSAAARATSWGGHFEQENLVELELYPAGEITKVDANWISDAPLRADGRLDPGDLSWIDGYWRGHPKNASPMWEIITSGTAVVLDAAVRRRAYELTQKTFPQCWEFIEMSRLAGEAGSNGGLLTPFLQRVNEVTLRLAYILYDGSFRDRNVIEKMTKHPDFIRLANYANANAARDLILPDFQPWWQDFEYGVQGVINSTAPIVSVHHTGSAT